MEDNTIHPPPDEDKIQEVDLVKPTDEQTQDNPKPEGKKQRFSNKKAILIVYVVAMVILLILALAGNYWLDNKSTTPQEASETVTQTTTQDIQRRAPSKNACSEEVKKCKYGDESVVRYGPSCEFDRCLEDPYFSPDKSRMVYIDYEYIEEGDYWYSTKYHLADSSGANDKVIYEDDPDPLSQTVSNIDESSWSPNGKYFIITESAPASPGQSLIYNTDGSNFASSELFINLNEVVYVEYNFFIQTTKWQSDSQVKISTYGYEVPGEGYFGGPDFIYNLETETLTEVPK